MTKGYLPWRYFSFFIPPNFPLCGLSWPWLFHNLREFLLSLSLFLSETCCAAWMRYWHYFAVRRANSLGEMKKKPKSWRLKVLVSLVRLLRLRMASINCAALLKRCSCALKRLVSSVVFLHRGLFSAWEYLLSASSAFWMIKLPLYPLKRRRLSVVQSKKRAFISRRLIMWISAWYNTIQSVLFAPQLR